MHRLHSAFSQIATADKLTVKNAVRRLQPTAANAFPIAAARLSPLAAAPKAPRRASPPRARTPLIAEQPKARSLKAIKSRAGLSADSGKRNFSLGKANPKPGASPLFCTVKQFKKSAIPPPSAVSRFFKMAKVPRGDERKPSVSSLAKFVSKITEPRISPRPMRLSPPRSPTNCTYNRPYFLGDLIRAYNSSRDDYFTQLFVATFAQITQSFSTLETIDLSDYRANGLEAHFSAEDAPVAIHNYNINYNFSRNYFGQTVTLASPPPPASPRRARRRKTLVFDLDETLVHCCEGQGGPCDARVPVVFPTGERIEAAINVRPYARELLVEMAEHFEIVVFTASHSCYANPVIDFLDPQRVVAKRLFREHCSQLGEELFTKDLSVLRGRNLKDIILVDNAVYSFYLNLGNGVAILPFYYHKKDGELLKLKSFLLDLRDADDVREVIGKYFRWELFQKHSSEPALLHKKLIEG